MQWTVYISQNNALIALKFRILKAKPCCGSSSERLQWKQRYFMHLIHYFIWFWHFGVLLYSRRLIKCLQIGAACRSPYLLSPQPSFFCLKLVCSSKNFSRRFLPGSVTTANPNVSTKVLVWGWPSHFPPDVAQQWDCKETLCWCRGSYCMSPCSKVGLTPPVGFCLYFGKQQECLEMYC